LRQLDDVVVGGVDADLARRLGEVLTGGQARVDDAIPSLARIDWRKIDPLRPVVCVQYENRRVAARFKALSSVSS
jgi:hypothetical protein